MTHIESDWVIGDGWQIIDQHAFYGRLYGIPNLALNAEMN